MQIWELEDGNLQSYNKLVSQGDLFYSNNTLRR